MNNKTTFVLSKELIDYILEWAASSKTNKPNYEQLVWLVEDIINKYNDKIIQNLQDEISDLESELIKLSQSPYKLD